MGDQKDEGFTGVFLRSRNHERNKRRAALQKSIHKENLPAAAPRKTERLGERAREIVLGARELGHEEAHISNREELEGELSKLFRSMHLMSERDIDATVTRVFRAMMRMGREGPVGSTELSRESGLNRITVIHHLKRLESAGVVEKRESKYVMRVQSIEEMMEGMREGMMRQFEEMDRMARDLDRAFLEDFERLEHGRTRKRKEKHE